MSYFSGIEWINYGELPRASVMIDKKFDYFLLNFARQGRLDWCYNGSHPMTLQGPIAFWTYPGPHFKFGTSDKSEWHHYFFAFKGERALKFVEQGLFPTQLFPPVQPIGAPELFLNAVEKLLEALEAPTRNEALTVHLLEGLLLALAQEIDRPSSIEPARQPIRHIINAMHQTPEHPFDTDQLAHQCGISLPHFRRRFIEETGEPPHRYLLNLRLQKAAKALRSSSKSIKEIALECGFEDLYHFTKMFKKGYQNPPAKYRKSTRFL